MTEHTLLRGADGAYYAFETELFESRRTAGEDGTYYGFSPEERAAARVPDDQVVAVEEAVGAPETVGFGFGDPVPGADVKLGKNPGGSLAVNVGSISFNAGMVAPLRPPAAGGGAARF